MSIFSKKCEYCRNKIEEDEEVVKNVKVPGYIGTSPKNFCSNGHVNKYEQEIKSYSNRPKERRGCC